MANSKTLLNNLKSKLRADGISYRELAQRLRLSEPTVKRDLSRGTFSLDRLDKICEVLQVSLEELAHHDARRPLDERDGCSAILALRAWEFSEFTKLRRNRK